MYKTSKCENRSSSHLFCHTSVNILTQCGVSFLTAEVSARTQFKFNFFLLQNSHIFCFVLKNTIERIDSVVHISFIYSCAIIIYNE